MYYTIVLGYSLNWVRTSVPQHNELAYKWLTSGSISQGGTTTSRLWPSVTWCSNWLTASPVCITRYPIMPYNLSLIITSEWRQTVLCLAKSRLSCYLPPVKREEVLTYRAGPGFHTFHYLLIYTRLSALAAWYLCITTTVTDSQTTLGWEDGGEQGGMRARVCVVVIKEQCHSSWLLWGDSMTVKVDVAAGDLRCLMTQELHD